MLTFVLGFAGVVWQWRQSEWHRRRAESQAYISDINAAQAALKDRNPARVLELLNRHRPSDSSRATDLRGFEWRYLWQQCQTEAELVGRMPSRIRSLEISPDGRWLVAGAELGGVTLWDRQTGEEIPLAPEAGTNGGTKGFANFSPDSTLVVYTDQTYASPGGRISLFDTRTRKRQPPITNSWWTGGVPAFSSDGRVFAYGIASPRFERGVVVMDFVTRNQIARSVARTGITSPIHGMDFVLTADGKSSIFSENDPDRRLGLWNFLGEAGTSYFPAHGEAITALAISPDGKTLASAAGWTETVIKLWEVPSFRPLGDLPGHQSWVAGLKFSPDRQTLASAGTDKTIRLWDVPTKSLRRSFGPLPQAVYRVCFAPDGKQVFGGMGDGSICCCRVDAPAPRVAWHDPAKLDGLAVSSHGRTLAGIRQGMVYLSKGEACAPTMPLSELGTNNVSLLFSPNGDTLFAGSQDGEVTIWPLSRHQPSFRLHLPPQPVEALGQDAAGQVLIVAQCEREVRSGRSCRVSLWHTDDWQEQRAWTFTAAVPCFAVSPDGRWLATGHLAGPVQIWDLAHFSGNRTFSFSGRITGVAFSPDGQFLAAASGEGMIKVWDVRGFREHAPFQAHSSEMYTLAFSPDSRRLLTGGNPREAIKFWDVRTWQQLITLERPSETLNQIGFSADGSQLMAKSAAGDLLFWRVPSFQEIETKERARRHL
jgi:WD40 repeat protein